MQQAQKRQRNNRNALDARAIRVARFLGRQLETHAIVKLNSGFVPHISLEFLQKQVPLLADLMLASNLAGRIDARKSAKRVDAKISLKLDSDVFGATISRMNNVLGNGVDVKSLEEKYNIVALRTLRNVADKTESEIRATAYNLIERGATVREAKQALSERFDAMGLTPRNSFQLETIYRTSSAIAYGAGTWQTYKDPDIQEILWGFTYSAVDDSRVRENHWAAEGVTLPKDDDFWQRMWPPNGYNCRCEVIPLYDDTQDIVEPPSDAYADPGFGFNPGDVIGEIDTTTPTPQPEPIPIPAEPLVYPEPESIPTEPTTTPFIPQPDISPADVLLAPDIQPTQAELDKMFGIKSAFIPVTPNELWQGPGKKHFDIPTTKEQKEFKGASRYGAPQEQRIALEKKTATLSAQSGLIVNKELVEKCAPAMLNEWCKAGAAMVNIFPELKDFKLNALNTKQYPKRKGVMGIASRTEQRLAMRMIPLSEAESIDKLCTSQGWWPKKRSTTHAYGTIIHEMGHHVGFQWENAHDQEYFAWAEKWEAKERHTTTIRERVVELTSESGATRTVRGKYRGGEVSETFSQYAGDSLQKLGSRSFMAEITAEATTQIMLEERSKWHPITQEYAAILEKKGYQLPK